MCVCVLVSRCWVHVLYSEIERERGGDREERDKDTYKYFIDIVIDSLVDRKKMRASVREIGIK